MEVSLYQMDGKSSKSVALPHVFSKDYRVDLMRRALLAEQSLFYQPQAHAVMAGIDTTAVYIGRYDAAWRRGRHMGQAIRPRQALGGGAQGDVRRIPSATKGRRAHPHKLEKRIVENINRREYVRALESAIAGCAHLDVIKANHTYEGKHLPIAVDNAIEKVAKTKDLIKFLDAVGLETELERSHDPSKRKGLRRRATQRKFRKNVLIVVDNPKEIEKAGRNIPGLDVSSVSDLAIWKLAPGANPRITIWSEGALKSIEKALADEKIGIKA